MHKSWRSNGTAPTNITFASGANAGYVAATSTSTTHTSWVDFSNSGYKGFDNGASGLGYANGAKWLSVADATGLAKAGKTAPVCRGFRLC